MKQYIFENKKLILKTNKAPFIIRICLYLITLFCFLIPLMVIVSTFLDNDDFKFTIFIVLGISGLIGFYLLRVSLWNTFGKEIIQFHKNEITYIADYYWFKDKLKSINNNNIKFAILDIGYEEDNLGTLYIQNDNFDEIISVIKIPKYELEKLIVLIQNEQN